MLMVTPRRLAMAGRDANELINVYCLVLYLGTVAVVAVVVNT